MASTDEKQVVSTAPLLAMSATAQNGLEKLGARLAELRRDGAAFGERDCEALLSRLRAAGAAAESCAELIRAMKLAPIEIPELLGEDCDEPGEGGSAAGAAPPAPRLSAEDEMFPAGEVSDALSGLPGRSIATRALQSAISVGRPRYAAVFSIDRLRYLSSRYGSEAGQQAIRHYGEYLRQKMPCDTMLFRWGGGSYLGIFDHSGGIGDARAISEQVSSQKVKLNFETNIRSALLNLTSAGLAIGLGPAASHPAVVADVDSFVDSHSKKQPDS